MAVLVQFPGVVPDGWSGPVFVEILPAVEREWHDSDRGRVRVTLPALRVSTYTDQARETGEGVKYRGRTYHVDYAFMFGAPGGDGGWNGETRDYYTRGFRNESGSSVDWKSPMRSRLYDFADAVRDAFVAENLGWVRESLALRLRWQIEHAERDARTAREAAEKADALAERLRVELAAL